MTLALSRQIFEKCSNIKFHKNPSSGRRLVPFGRTDRQTWRFLQFCERAEKVKLSVRTPWRHMGSGGVAPRIINVRTKWRPVVSFTPRPPYLWGKSSRLPIEYEAAWAPELVWTFRRRGESLAPESVAGCRENGNEPVACMKLVNFVTIWATAGFWKRFLFSCWDIHFHILHTFITNLWIRFKQTKCDKGEGIGMVYYRITEPFKDEN
jgi:hypothetical protein